MGKVVCDILAHLSHTHPFLVHFSFWIQEARGGAMAASVYVGMGIRHHCLKHQKPWASVGHI